MHIEKVFTLLIIIITSIGITAQHTVYNNGADITISEGGLFYINGNMYSTGIAASVTNKGTLETKNSVYDGDMLIEDNSAVLGNGDFKIEGDWVNNANFITNATTNASRVILTGNNQFITGSNISVFHDLELQGGGTIKSLSLDARVSDTLDLNNNELFTDVHSLFVDNPSVNSVLYDNTYQDEGYVSSNLGGRLARLVNTTSSYDFPVGSSLGTERFRKIIITPQSITQDTFSVTFLNYEASIDALSIDSLDSNICFVNDLYYHKIKPSFGSTATIESFYDPMEDLYQFQHMAQWNQPDPDVWNHMDQSLSNVNTGNYYSVLQENWNSFNNDQFILSLKQSAAPVLNGPNFICYGLDSILFTAQGSVAPYVWNFPSGTQIISGQGTDSILVNWGFLTDTVTVNGDSASACPSKTGFFIPDLSNSVIANFTVDSVYTLADQIVSFFDASSGNITSWQWEFGDSLSSSLSDPQHIYAVPDTYAVVLTVKDSLGCMDTSMKRIWVDEFVFIPNVFSPNGDGLNDYFVIPFAVAQGNYQLSIYNRWGQLLFESSSYKLAWDGNSNSGAPAPPGTYYFKLEAITPDNDYSTTGYFTLLR